MRLLVVFALWLASCTAATEPSLDFNETYAALEIVTPTEDSFLAGVVEREVAACMSTLGHEYEIPSSVPLEMFGVTLALTLPEQWAFDNVEAASVNGYGLGDLLVREEGNPFKVPPQSDEAPEFSTQYLLDLMGSDDQMVFIVELDGSQSGTGRGGCLGQARASVWGSVEDFLTVGDVASFMASESHVAAIAGGAVRSALREWRECMTNHGFVPPEGETLEPQNVVSEVWSRYGSGTRAVAWEEEKRTAVAHAQCSADSGLGGEYRERFREESAKLLADYESEILGARELIDAALKRAEAILERQG